VAATAQYLSDVACALTARGHDVTVVCSRRAYDNPSERYARRDVWRGITIRRISSFGFGKTARWRRAMDFGSYLAASVWHLAWVPRFDLVVALTSPPLISWLGALFTRVKGGRFVFWVMDLNPDEAVAAGWLRRDSRTARLLQTMLRFSLREAAAVIVLDRFMAGRVADKGVDRRKIAVVPPWSQDATVRYDPAGREDFRREHGLGDRHVVMYAGNHSPCHPLTTLLEAAARLRDRTDVVFCFMGGGSQFEGVRQFARTRRLKNVVTVGYQPQARLSAALSAADLHAVVMGDPFVGLVHPCKVYNVRTLGIPYLYIGPADSHVADLAPPFSAAHGDVDAVVAHIETSAALRAGRATSAAAAGAYSQDRVLERVVSVLENAAPAPPRAFAPVSTEVAND
jgi:hypothetical protein